MVSSLNFGPFWGTLTNRGRLKEIIDMCIYIYMCVYIFIYLYDLWGYRIWGLGLKEFFFTSSGLTPPFNSTQLKSRPYPRSPL